MPETIRTFIGERPASASVGERSSAARLPDILGAMRKKTTVQATANAHMPTSTAAAAPVGAPKRAEARRRAAARGASRCHASRSGAPAGRS